MLKKKQPFPAFKWSSFTPKRYKICKFHPNSSACLNQKITDNRLVLGKHKSQPHCASLGNDGSAILASVGTQTTPSVKGGTNVDYFRLFCWFKCGLNIKCQPSHVECVSETKYTT